MNVFQNLTEFRAANGTTFPPSDWITITQEMINKFAEATLDFQWIHTDVERAKKESPFGGAIAHGFMSVSMLSKFLEDTIKVESMKMGVNYGLDKVRFPHPVPAEAKLRLLMGIASIEDQKPNGVKVFWNCKLEIQGIDKPACVATFITLMFE